MTVRKIKSGASNSNCLPNEQSESATASATVPLNHDLEQNYRELSDSHQLLKSENDQLKASIFVLKEEKQNVVNDLENTRTQSQMNINDAEVAKWRQRARDYETELKKTQSELYASHEIRRDLLNSMLNLQGRVRVMARLRPVLKTGTNEVRLEINTGHNKLKCKFLFLIVTIWP